MTDPTGNFESWYYYIYFCLNDVKQTSWFFHSYYFEYKRGFQQEGSYQFRNGLNLIRAKMKVAICLLVCVIGKSF